jgi:hypothetical protein
VYGKAEWYANLYINAVLVLHIYTEVISADHCWEVFVQNVKKSPIVCVTWSFFSKHYVYCQYIGVQKLQKESFYNPMLANFGISKATGAYLQGPCCYSYKGPSVTLSPVELYHMNKHPLSVSLVHCYLNLVIFLVMSIIALK